MNESKIRIHGKFQALMKLAQQLDKSPKRFGTDELLTHSEIHLIEIIGSAEGSSVTDLGKLMGVTKGAISQGLKKLEQKGYVSKSSDPDNSSRAIVSLTAKGYTAYWAHKHWHETMDGGFSKYLDELSSKEMEVIVGFLERVEDFLQRRMKSME